MFNLNYFDLLLGKYFLSCQHSAISVCKDTSVRFDYSFWLKTVGSLDIRNAQQGAKHNTEAVWRLHSLHTAHCNGLYKSTPLFFPPSALACLSSKKKNQLGNGKVTLCLGTEAMSDISLQNFLDSFAWRACLVKSTNVQLMSCMQYSQGIFQD